MAGVAQRRSAVFAVVCSRSSSGEARLVMSELKAAKPGIYRQSVPDGALRPSNRVLASLLQASSRWLGPERTMRPRHVSPQQATIVWQDACRIALHG